MPIPTTIGHVNREVDRLLRDNFASLSQPPTPRFPELCLKLGAVLNVKGEDGTTIFDHGHYCALPAPPLALERLKELTQSFNS
jgi:hypothetical protein